MSKPASDLYALAQFLDSKFKGPFGFRFGWDGLLGLIPGVGNLITNLLSLYIILRSVMLGISVSVLLRMLFNLLLENLVGVVPIVGNVFDFVWKANEKNLKLASNYQAKPTQTSRWALMFNMSIVVLCLGLIAALFWLSIWVFNASYDFTSGLMS